MRVSLFEYQLTGIDEGGWADIAHLTTRHWRVDDAPTAITFGGLQQ